MCDICCKQGTFKCRQTAYIKLLTSHGLLHLIPTNCNTFFIQLYGIVSIVHLFIRTSLLLGCVGMLVCD